MDEEKASTFRSEKKSEREGKNDKVGREKEAQPSGGDRGIAVWGVGVG